MSKQTTHIHKLIADYLKENNYPETLKQFEIEHGNRIHPSKLLDESLHDIITDRLQYNTLIHQTETINVNDELNDDLKTIIRDEFTNWITPYPNTPSKLVNDIHGLVIGSCYSPTTGMVYFSTNDSKVYVVKGNDVVNSIKMPVVIKNVLCVGDSDVILVGMNGTLYLRHEESLVEVSDFQAHRRLIVDAKYIKSKGKEYIVSLGYDFYVRLIELENGKFRLLSEIKLQQQGSCFDVTEYQNQVIIVLGKLENTLLDVISVNGNDELVPLYKISLNDAEFTASGFSPRSLTIQSLDIPLVAVGTSHEPYMRVIIVPLQEQNTTDGPIKRNQIIKNLNTMSPQDRYSQPIISWRLCKQQGKASGVWVMGDDGIIRGLDIKEDKVVVELKNGHEGKIKDFISYIDDENGEKLITCGLDREILEWK
ncbi:hypothetical protein SBY92_005001 [Candida maltosa Xu316]|uniref:LisH domain-containing protein n=1 Tax=Candida maltosa (strain Xu316) TaxID=1245528 RepID=M3IGW1_CANMX|nr:hypothetical protein G210_4310 [Candida maltosa Xu316]